MTIPDHMTAAMGDRDPRTNPQPGDVLRTHNSSTLTVVARKQRAGWGDSVIVDWEPTQLRTRRLWTLLTWREMTRDADVVSIGEARD